MPIAASHRITAISVRQLFGLYSYSLPAAQELPNAAILYGDNGLGKTTILRMVYHLLSAATNRGHRTKLHAIPFNVLRVSLASGVEFSATRVGEDLCGPLRLVATSPNAQPAVWEFEPTSQEAARVTEGLRVELDSEGRIRRYTPRALIAKRKKDEAGEEAFMSALAQHAPVMYMLTSDRILDSDAIADPSDELELRRLMRYEEPKRLGELVARTRQIGLSQALAAAANLIRTKALQSTNTGSMNVHSVYLSMVRQLTDKRRKSASASALVDSLLEKLTEIERRTAELARYELAAPLPIEELRAALSLQKITSRRDLAASLLAPYVSSLEGRLDAVNPIYSVVDRLVTTVNRFLTDKTLLFRLSQGFAIHNRLGTTLEPDQLSSGEQQLLLLFSYIVTGRDRPSVFMIDEPEISLNIKWQRQLIQSLLHVAEESPTQFVFASHSLELLTQYRDRVVALSNEA